MKNNKENAKKAKFYRNNTDIFLKYFDDIFQYKALINAENWDKIEQIIKEQTNFSMSIMEEITNNLTK